MSTYFPNVHHLGGRFVRLEVEQMGLRIARAYYEDMPEGDFKALAVAMRLLGVAGLPLPTLVLDNGRKRLDMVASYIETWTQAGGWDVEGHTLYQLTLVLKHVVVTT